MKKINKKAMDMVSVLTMVVAVIVIVFVITKFGGGSAKNLGTIVDSNTMKMALSSCIDNKIDIQKNIRPDKNQNGLPDCCDPCPDVGDSGGKTAPDNDGDGFVDGCWGNNGALPKKEDGTLDVAKYVEKMKKAGSKQEFGERATNPKEQPLYVALEARCPP